MKSGSESTAPQFRAFNGIEKSKPEADASDPLPDSREPDVTKAALPQPMSQSQKRNPSLMENAS